MNKVKIYFVTVAVDIVNGKFYTLVVNDDQEPHGVSIPYIYNDYETDVELLIKDKITEYLNVNPDWLKISLYNRIRNRNSNLELFYYFSVPYDAIKVVDPEKSALINFDVICAYDPMICNIKYFI